MKRSIFAMIAVLLWTGVAQGECPPGETPVPGSGVIGQVAAPALNSANMACMNDARKELMETALATVPARVRLPFDPTSFRPVALGAFLNEGYRHRTAEKSKGSKELRNASEVVSVYLDLTDVTESATSNVNNEKEYIKRAPREELREIANLCANGKSPLIGFEPGEAPVRHLKTVFDLVKTWNQPSDLPRHRFGGELDANRPSDKEWAKLQEAALTAYALRKFVEKNSQSVKKCALIFRPFSESNDKNPWTLNGSSTPWMNKGALPANAQEASVASITRFADTWKSMVDLYRPRGAADISSKFHYNLLATNVNTPLTSGPSLHALKLLTRDSRAAPLVDAVAFDVFIRFQGRNLPSYSELMAPWDAALSADPRLRKLPIRIDDMGVEKFPGADCFEQTESSPTCAKDPRVGLGCEYEMKRAKWLKEAFDSMGRPGSRVGGALVFAQPGRNSWGLDPVCCKGSGEAEKRNAYQVLLNQLQKRQLGR